jgi:hypothetical protein
MHRLLINLDGLSILVKCTGLLMMGAILARELISSPIINSIFLTLPVVSANEYLEIQIDSLRYL